MSPDDAARQREDAAIRRLLETCARNAMLAFAVKLAEVVEASAREAEAMAALEVSAPLKAQFVGEARAYRKALALLRRCSEAQALKGGEANA
jgi:hypothetical protein